MPVSVNGLDLGYRGQPLLRNVSFSMAAGDVLAVVGHNGSGKTTLVKTLLGVLPPVRGQVDWPGGPPHEIAYLGQLTEFDRNFPILVRDLATMGAWKGLGFFNAINDDRRNRVEDALDKTGITDIADRPLHELSSGQLQRALFARTMVQDAPLILLDEPFTAVDQTTEAALLQLIDDWSAQGRAIILVLHDLSAILRHCTSALLLGAGKARFGKPEDVLTPTNLVEQGYMTEKQSTWLNTMYGDPKNGDAQTPGASGHV